MLTAFVSDIHANLEALEAVLAHIHRQNPDRIICLGDVVNYGPDPAECLRIARRFDLTLLGNHEEAVLGHPYGFNPVAAEAARWTRGVLRPGLLSDGARRSNWEFMQSLPLRHTEDGLLLVHASPRAPTTEYLLPFDIDPLFGSEKLTQCFQLVDKICFVGHTHIPCAFHESMRFEFPQDIGNELVVSNDEKIIVNIGSVGQPRDRNNRACYVTYDGEVVRWHRVPYEIHKTCAKILKTALPQWCAKRLLKGE